MRLWRYNRSLETLGQRYHLRGALGSGGMADVCLAWDEREQREVAIKVIKPDELDQRALDRFMKEAAKISHWRHPHILRVYSELTLELIDPTHGSMVPYIVMEYAAGGDLQKRLRAGHPFPLKGIMALFPQLCSAVSYAHKQGVIHRDLKPLNILFRVLPDESEQVVLSDFGLAVEISATHHTYASGGTLPYMAPEQLRGAALPESDIFALGVILYQLCTGRLPFRRTLFEVGHDLARNQKLPPPPLPSSIQPLLPSDLDAVILRALAHDPRQRYRDAEDLWQATQAALLDPSNPRHTFTVSYPSPSAPPFTEEPHSDEIPSASSPLISLDEDDTDLNSLDDANAPVPTPHNTFNTRRLPSNSFSRSLTPSPDDMREPDNPDLIPESITPPHPNSHPRSVVPPRRSRPDSFSGSLTPSRRSRSDSFSESLTPSRRSRANPNSQSLTPRANVSKRRPYLYIALAALLIIALIGGTIFTLPGLRGLATPITNLFSGNRATITITAFSRLEKNSYTVEGVASNPDPAKSQITVRPVTATTQSNTQTINGSGKKQTPGTQAKGELTFSNGSFVSFTVASGTQIKSNDGTAFVTDTATNIPAADPNTAQVGFKSVSAHAVENGNKGNIPALSINHTCCKNDGSVFVKNTSPFTGGTDPQNYTYITEQDANAVADILKAQTIQDAQNKLRGEMQLEEEMANNPQCTTKLNSSQPIGDTGKNITSTNISVTATCKGFAYNKQELQRLLTPKLQQQASTDLGDAYNLRGSITTLITQQQQATDHITWTIEASGTWIYTLNNAVRQNIAHHIAGQTISQARSWLHNQPGVAALDINYPGDRLPNDPNLIDIVVKT